MVLRWGVSMPGATPTGQSRPRRGAVFVAAGILASRLAGLVRMQVFAHYFGVRSDAADAFNAITSARKPYWDGYWKNCPHTKIQASEAAVGLPAGQMGKAEPFR